MYRFSIRDVLLVTIIIAWGLDRWRLSIAQDRLSTIVAELASRDCEVEMDDDGLWISYPPDCSGTSP
jgi:hypothetical protein